MRICCTIQRVEACVERLSFGLQEYEKERVVDMGTTFTRLRERAGG